MKFTKLILAIAAFTLANSAQAYVCEYKTVGNKFTRTGGLNEQFTDGSSYNMYECVDRALADFAKTDTQTVGRYGFKKVMHVLPHTLNIEIEGDNLSARQMDLLNSKIDLFVKNSDQFLVEQFTLNDDSDEAFAKIKRVK